MCFNQFNLFHCYLTTTLLFELLPSRQFNAIKPFAIVKETQNILSNDLTAYSTPKNSWVLGMGVGTIPTPVPIIVLWSKKLLK